MNKVALLLIGLCFFLYSGLIAQTLVNGDLELWEIQENVTFDVKENPKGWVSRNYAEPNPQAIFCYSTTDSYSGEKAAVLQNFNPSPGVSLSSFLSLGTFDIDFPEKKGGVSFSERPDALQFAYKYFTTETNPSGFYNAKASIELTKWDEQTKQRVVVGKGEYQISHKRNFYQLVEVPVEYFMNDQPDSMHIIFSTPNNPDDQIRLTIDNVLLRMNTTVANDDKLYLDQVSLFPNPVTDWLNFFNPTDIDDAELLVFNAMGQLLLNQPISGTDGKIDCKDLHAGMYFYQIRQSDELVKAGKLMKNNL